MGEGPGGGGARWGRGLVWSSPAVISLSAFVDLFSEDAVGNPECGGGAGALRAAKKPLGVAINTSVVQVLLPYYHYYCYIITKGVTAILSLLSAGLLLHYY